MRSWSRAWKRGEDNHIRLLGGGEEDATVTAALVRILLQRKISVRGDGIGRRSWRKRTRWHSCFLVLGGLRRPAEKQEEDNNSEEKKQEGKSSNDCSHYSLHRGGGGEW